MLCSSILLFAAVFHAYWAFGGRRGYAVAIPQYPDGRRVFEPSRRGTLVVASLILLAALWPLVAAGYLPVPVPRQWLRIGTAALALLFTVRAVGWFQFAGFFKSVRHTEFGRFDTRVYCPLCLVLGLGLGRLAWVGPVGASVDRLIASDRRGHRESDSASATAAASRRAAVCA